MKPSCDSSLQDMYNPDYPVCLYHTIVMHLRLCVLKSMEHGVAASQGYMSFTGTGQPCELKWWTTPKP